MAMIPPELSPTLGDCWAVAALTAHRVLKCPDTWVGRTVRVQALNANIWVGFGTATTIEVDSAARNTRNTTTKVLTASSTVGTPIPAGQYRDFEVEVADTYMAFEAEATGAVLSAYPLLWG